MSDDDDAFIGGDLDVVAGQVLGALVVGDVARAVQWARVLEAIVGPPPVDQDGPRA